MIINLTQHPATPEQIAAGVVDLQGKALEGLKALLTFDDLPTQDEITLRAVKIAQLAVPMAGPLPDGAMIGGAPYLMAPLEYALGLVRVQPMYAFSVRESIEQTQPDGSVRKVNVFRHAGFVGGVA